MKSSIYLNMLRIGLLCAITLLFSVLGFAQSASNRLGQRLDSIAATSELPGFTVGIVGKDKVHFQRSYGFANPEKTIPLNNRHAILVASVSKTLIGVSLLKCVEIGLLDLNDDINKHLPFRVENPRFPDQIITIRHLATHTSGIQDQIDDEKKIFFEQKFRSDIKLKKKQKKSFKKIQQNKKKSLHEQLKEIFIPGTKYYSKKIFTKNEAGSNYQYSNMAAALAALIVENVSGTKYEKFVQAEIFRPLQIRTASFYPLKIPNDQICTQFTGKNLVPLPVYTHLYPPIGGLYICNAELSIYFKEILSGYYGSGKILPQESYQILLKSAFSTENKPSGFYNSEYDSGIFWLHRFDGQIGHTGGGLGASTFMFFNPKTGIGKFIITNCELQSSKNFVAPFKDIWSAMSELEDQIAQ